VIHFTIPRASSVSLKVYNIVGQEVAALLGSTLPAGGFWTTWDGRDKNGMTVSSGVYFYRLQAGDYAETKKMLLMK
jgi:flagellar hook assembly protein FlgD